MEKRVVVTYLIGIFLSVFLLSFVGASYNFSDHSIQDTYSKGASISGDIEISFSNEPINSIFSDSLGNSVELRDLLFSSNYNYHCGYSNCESKFNSVQIAPTFSFSLPNGSSAYYGLVFNENLIKINSVNFEIVSDAGESDINQISVDFFDDGEIEVKNPKSGNSFGEENFGCFGSGEDQTELTITTTPYCQKVSLYDAPGLRMGAWVREAFSGTKNVTMSLYKENGAILNSCHLPKNGMSSSGTRVYCDVGVSITEGDYYVCIRGGGVGNGDYKVRGYSQITNCGFQGNPPANHVYTYEIGVSERNFGSVGTIQVQNNLSSGNLSSMIQNYIVSKYGSKDCSTASCFVPIKIISSKDQSVTLKNLNVNYDFQGGSGAIINTFHKFEEDPSKINSSMNSLSLGQFFKLPDEEDEVSYKFYFEGDELFEEDISIKDFGINLYPTKVAAGFPSEFSLIVPSDLDISLYTWNFGDNASTTSLTSKVRHTYTQEGNFTISISLSTDIGMISTSFFVEVGSPEEVLSQEIQNRKERIENFEEEILLFDTFERNQVNKFVNLSYLKSELQNIEEESLIASNDEEYAYIVSRLLNLSFPVSIVSSQISQSFFVPSQSSINLEALSSVTGRNYNDTPASYDYILFWNVENLDSDISEKNIVIEWDEKPKSIIRFFEVIISQSRAVDEDYYFLIRNFSGLSFESEGEFEQSGDYRYMKIPSSNKRISFSITESGPVSNFLFISPAIVESSELGQIQESNNNLLIIILGMAGVLLIGLLVYIILHKWYKVKYERYLFPDKNHLYNAIFYINNSVKNGMEEYEIRKSLLSAGWKGEQVRYLMKKYAGKRTGMVDIFGFMKSENSEKVPNRGAPPNPGFNSEYQERGRNTRFNK